MTREDNPEYYAHVCEVIKGVLKAENRCIRYERIVERFKAGDIIGIVLEDMDGIWKWCKF